MKRKSQSDHDKMVKYAAEYFLAKNFKNVKADIENYENPNKITWNNTKSGHIPDVSGMGDKLYIIEVETDDSIYDEHTKDQWTIFSVFANQHNAEFWVVVPKGSKVSAEKRILELQLTAKVWEI